MTTLQDVYAAAQTAIRAQDKLSTYKARNVLNKTVEADLRADISKFDETYLALVREIQTPQAQDEEAVEGEVIE